MLNMFTAVIVETAVNTAQADEQAVICLWIDGVYWLIAFF